MKTLRLWVALLLGACSGAVTLNAETWSIASGPTRIHLLELFTSEGCSSCPPAEAWLSTLQKEPGLWRDFVPVAFHVDYWDRLGWRDPFAAKAWTARQYDYAAEWKNGSVYTPAFVLDGREWRDRSVPAAGGAPAGTLKLTRENDGVRVSYATTGKAADKPLEVHVAQLGFGLQINVGAGENRGRKLQHDFVVLALASARLERGEAELRLPTPNVPLEEAGRRALVAWVTAPGDMEPVQAVGGWLK